MVDVKRIDRKELLKREDKFISFVKKTLKFITDNKKNTAFAFGFLFIMAIGAFGFKFYLENREEKAFLALEETKNVYINTINSKGLKDGYEAAKERFENLFKKFPNSVSAKMGRLIYGNLAYLAKDYKAASEIYSKALDDFKDDKIYKNIILNNIAYSKMMIGDKAKSIETFEKIAANDNSILKDSALFNLGIIYEKEGKRDKSRQSFEKIVFVKDSIFTPMINEEMGIIYE